MFDIDAVITWVDGADPLWRAKRDHHQSSAQSPLHDNGINPHRWICSDELSFCIRSIANNAPWVRKVWIITDNQIPELPPLDADFANKIAIVDHREIFAGHEAALPTFNSLSIETMLWRIPGLADHFLYFNDDVFLTAATKPDDFFTTSGPVMRGNWVNYAHLPDCDQSRDKARLLNHYNQINAARMMGYPADRIFASAHTVHPMQRSVMEALFIAHTEDFITNIGHAFRCTQQFLPQSLHNHYCLKQERGSIQNSSDCLHVAVGASARWTREDVHEYMESAERHAVKFLCINDLPELERYIPDVRTWIENAIGQDGAC
jgi:hypothetical protein